MQQKSTNIAHFSKVFFNNIIVLLAILISTRFDFLFYQFFKNASLFFIAPAIAILMMTAYKKNHYLYGVFFGCSLAHLLNQFSIPISLGLGLGMTAEAYIGHKIYEYFVINHKSSLDVFYRLVSISFVALLAPIIHVLVFSLSVDQFKNLYGSALTSLFITNYLREFLGIFFVFSLNYKLIEKKIRFWHYFFIPIVFMASIYLTKYNFESIFYIGIFLFILPARFGFSGLPAILNLGFLAAFYYFKYYNIGPFNLASVNQEVTSYQMVEISFLITYITVDELTKSEHFKSLFRPILVLWFFSFVTFYVAFKQEHIAEKENIVTIDTNFRSRLDEKFHMYDNNLRSISSFVKSTPNFNQNIWDNYSNQLKILQNYPEIEAFGLIVGENNTNYSDHYIFPADKEMFVHTLLQSKDLDEQFSQYSLSETPVLSNKLNLPKDYNDLSLSIIILPIIKDFKVVSWTYYIIDNKTLFDQITNQIFNYNIQVYDGNFIGKGQKIYDNSENINKHYEYQNSLIFANHKYNIGWVKSPYFKTSRFILSPFVALLSSIISSLLISFLLSIRKQKSETDKINENLKIRASDSEKRYQTIFSISSEGIVIFNKNKLIEANKKFYQLFDLSDDIFEINFIDLFSTFQDNLVESVKVIPDKVKETDLNGTCKFEAICKRGNNSFHAEIKLNKFMYNENDYYIAHIIDITDRKRIEMNLIQSKEFAIEASKAKSRFLSNMSHEIRTPLNGILGLIQVMLEDRQLLNNQTVENLEIMEYSTNHLLHILNEILDYSKIETGKINLELRNANLKKLAKNISLVHREMAKKKNVSLNVFIDEQIPEYLVFDELRNGQILNNFLSNALKFTEKGEINLRLSLIKINESHATVNFEVTDTGIGIPKDKIEYIFNEFTQASEDHTRRFGGTGLGLPISKKLIELQGGKIRVQSYVDVGTSMSYALSFKIDTQNYAKSETENKNEINYQLIEGKKVLIVEDNEVNVLVVKKFLEKWKINFEIVNDGDEAVTKVKNNSYDLVLMDFHMPKMDGVTATKLIREFNQQIPIVGLSADITHELKSDFHKYLMNDFLPKPFKSKELLLILDKYLKNVR